MKSGWPQVPSAILFLCLKWMDASYCVLKDDRPQILSDLIMSLVYDTINLTPKKRAVQASSGEELSSFVIQHHWPLSLPLSAHPLFQTSLRLFPNHKTYTVDFQTVPT